MLDRTRWVRLVGTAHDTIVAAIAFFLAYALAIGPERVWTLPYLPFKAAGFALGGAALFYVFSLNRGSWRYASIADLFAILKASATLVFCYVAASFMFERGAGLPRSTPVFMLLLLVFGLGAPRLAVRLFKERRHSGAGRRPKPQSEKRRVLLYGLNDNAEMFVRAVARMQDKSIGVMGIVDDAKENHRLRIHGHKVLGSSDALQRIVRERAAKGAVIKELVVADRSLTPAELARLVEKATNAGLAVSRLPDLTSRHEISENQIIELKPINLVDLLGRPEVKVDTLEVARLIDGKRVLITGAGGSIGSELARQIASFNPRSLVLTDNSEFLLYSIDMELRERFLQLDIAAHVADVRDRDRIAALFRDCGPDVVFHAAALKHVPMVEDNPVEAIKTNVLGTQNVADAALAAGTRAFVMISTDKAVNPTSVMGATKRAAEAYCQALDLASGFTRFKTVRFGNVVGSNGSVVPRFRDQIAKGGPITVTHPEIVRYFMSIPEAVRLVLQASGHGMRADAGRGKILVLDMGPPVGIVDLATKMIQLAGLRPGVDIKIEFTGLRPGEKLFEEMFDDSEVVVPVPGRGYSVATPRAMNDKILRKAFGELKAAAHAEDREATLKLLRHVVPEFRPDEQEQRPAPARPRSADATS
jgi:FlaA1/EpsC-like NDP-sugar epimerase